MNKILIIGDLSEKEKEFWKSFSVKIKMKYLNDGTCDIFYCGRGAYAQNNFIINQSEAGYCLFVIALDLNAQRTAIKASKLGLCPIIVIRYWRKRDALNTKIIDKCYLNNLIRRQTRANLVEFGEIIDETASSIKRDFEIPIKGAASDDIDLAATELAGLVAAGLKQNEAAFNLPSIKTSGIRLAYVTHFYCNQNSAATIFDLLERYGRYSQAILSQIHFVIVDDGSSIEYTTPKYNLNITWLRIDQDISWNQSGARNLGVLMALSDNIIVTDVDHVFPEESLSLLLTTRKPGDKISLITKRDSEGNVKNPHPNIHYLSRARFLSLYGFDEEFAGGYGAEDVRFPELQRQHGMLLSRLPKKIWCEEREEINRDREYHSLIRDVRRNHIIEARKRAEVGFYGENGGFSRRMLNFTWTILFENIMPEAARGIPQRHWHFWRFARQWRTWLRSLLG